MLLDLIESKFIELEGVIESLTKEVCALTEENLKLDNENKYLKLKLEKQESDVVAKPFKLEHFKNLQVYAE